MKNKRKCSSCKWFTKLDNYSICEIYDARCKSGDSAKDCEYYKSRKYERVRITKQEFLKEIE